MPHYGFNFQWMFNCWPGSKPEPVNESALDFMAEFGFDFVRLPLDYRFWTTGTEYFDPDLSVWDTIDTYLEACLSRHLHVSLNLHRAPGYCINQAYLEQHNLWRDAIAQEAFLFLWEQFAWRYRGLPGAALSFDLINEPPHDGQAEFTRAAYAGLMRRTVASIRRIDPAREIVINGIGEGNLAIPELSDLDVVFSTRGYQPMPISHAQASWWSEHQSAPAPEYPGLHWQGRTWNRKALAQIYLPWRQMQEAGAIIHVGEFGCYQHTPNEIALRWFEDLLGLYREYGWGYSLWEFAGPFGLVEHGRPGAQYRKLAGFQVDSTLLDLLLQHRV